MSYKMGSYQKQIINLRFNQDKNCFVCCMENGIRIYYVEPLVEKVHYDERCVGSVRFCEMVYRSNLFAIISGGSRPKYADNSILVFDDTKKQSILEFTFNETVLSVRCRRDRLVAVLKNNVHIFSFPHTAQKLFSIETRPNPKGLCELSTGSSSLLVFPGFKVGSLQLVNLATTEATVSSSPVIISAHKSELGCISVNQQGTLVATASLKGTLIRVWDVVKKTLVNEFRRGADTATLYCITFSPDSEYFCCSSDKGTIHIFAVKNANRNRRSTFSQLSVLGHYVESQWALANFTVPPECACVCAFAPGNSVVAICMDGTFHKYSFNAEVGGCSRQTFDVFLEITGEDEF